MIEDMEMGCAGPAVGALERARRTSIFRGTAVQPYASTAGLLIL